jgi:quercetin dioxygenase-like cupin family protein
MKTNPSRTRAPLACALLLASAGVAGQDPAAVGTGVYRCTLENAHSRVCEVTFAPGARMPRHSHPAHVVYVLQPGTLRITDDTTGKSEDHVFKAGDAVWMDPVTHHAENTSNKTVKAIVVEYRDVMGTTRTMNEAPPMDVPRTMNEAPPMDPMPMEKPPMGQPPTEQAPPDPMNDGTDDPVDP